MMQLARIFSYTVSQLCMEQHCQCHKTVKTFVYMIMFIPNISCRQPPKI